MRCTVACLFPKAFSSDLSFTPIHLTCSVFVALSAIANVFAVVFSQGKFYVPTLKLEQKFAEGAKHQSSGRLNQALGREGVIPFSKIFASNRPFKAPLAGVTWHVIVTLVILLAPPAGDVSRQQKLA